MNMDTDLDRVTSAYSTEITDTSDDQNMQMNSDNVERDVLAITRGKRLQVMCNCSILMVLVSIFAIVVGVLAILNSDDILYILGGGVIAGGMSLLLTICPFCMWIEGRKTKTGTKMSGLFKCNLICLMVWFSFCVCGILMAMGISGIWGTVTCLQEKQNPGKSSINLCKEETSKKLTYSVLTLVLSALLLILTIVIMCLFCCNTKAFGYKTVRQRRYEYYRNNARAEIEREMIEERTNESRDQARELDGYENNRNNRHDENRRERHDYFSENERERPIQPSAPPHEDNANHVDIRTQRNRRLPQRNEQERDHFVRHYEDKNSPRRSPEDRHSPRRPNDGRERPRRPDDDRYRPRRPNDGRERPRRPDDERHRPRRPNDDRERPRRPDDERHRPRRPDGDRSRPRRPDEGSYRTTEEEEHRSGRSYDNRSGDDHVHASRFVNRENENDSECTLENQTEAPPPSYDEVVNKYLKADDV
ncbi:uncharacterized protein LOC132747404 [Ruditapes philippinarum]|uniref:uncharacterized protein LOC132747404 n=1 Tax=Ruditapes philippinarum TaxID=129788 RepID=UPI00295A9DAD|nr:uncharacterized protein LOC132747404 [Ruditapes philippinarum]XP_060592759.1 uncharacterized protein LOC132747404 [Ruditapes philippinarum]